MNNVSEHDQAELDKFARYLSRLGQWERENDDRPDFAPIKPLHEARYQRLKMEAQMKIYKEIYGEDSP